MISLIKFHFFVNLYFINILCLEVLFISILEFLRDTWIVFRLCITGCGFKGQKAFCLCTYGNVDSFVVLYVRKIVLITYAMSLSSTVK